MPRRRIIPYDPKLKMIARELRNNSTKSEICLWLELKGKQMCGYDFHRQKPIDRHIVDFFYSELDLCIELDGYSHNLDEVAKNDLIKEERLRSLGLSVLRFDDREVFGDMENVLKTIECYIEEYEKTHP